MWKSKSFQSGKFVSELQQINFDYYFSEYANVQGFESKYLVANISYLVSSA